MLEMDEVPGISDGMSSHQAAQKGSVVENISDDQELFLKVLENLKNAVNLKPDNYSVAQPKQQCNPQEGNITDSEPKQHNYQQEGIIDPGPITTVGVQKDLIRTDCTISTDESQLRSDSHEPSLSKVTVSDKTKSLILQKINVSSELDRNKVEGLNVKSKGTESQIKVGQCVENQVQISSIFSRQQDTSVNNLNVTVVGLNQHVNTNIDRESSAPSSKIAGFITKVQDSPNTNQSGKVRVLAPNTSPKQLHTCNQCDYYSENKNYLKQHIDLVHNNDRPYKCPYCEYAGKRSHALREHLIVHSNERPYQCKSCNATFRKKGHLTNHIKLHNSKRLVKCPLCKMLVYDTGENGLDAHLKNEHDTERLYGCDLCDHIAANEPEILQHLKTQHKSKLVAYRCDRCPFVTSNTADFNAHMDAHTMSNASVKLGDNKSGNVVAVAALPRETAIQEMPNTAVTVGKADDTQAAVIKPVWIKCSECGFTAQDSEVIKKHMLEHLGMEVVPEKTQNHVQQILSPLKTKQKQSSQQQTLPASAPKTTVTVPTKPVTNLDNIVHHLGRKLDMNSPVLVPVSDPALLKSLQSLPLGSLPSSAKLVQINPSLITSAVGPSNIVQQPANNAVNNTNIPTVVVSNQPYMDKITPAASLKPSDNVTNTFSSPVVMSNQQVLPLQNNQMPISNTYLKVIPVTNHQASTVMGSQNPGVSVVASQSPAIVRPNGDNQLVTTSTVQTQQKHVNIPKIAGFQLSQIPVPRNFAPAQVPKLPPEILSIGNTLDVVERRQTEVVKENVQPVDQKTAVLQESLANIQHLIEEQNKLNKKMGHPVVKLNSKGIPEQASKQNIVYYISPVEKQNTTIRADKMDGFTHDSNAGRFKCTLCGYTCEYQRTIKAHVWKHSGNKNIDYPMFQNGPLSIYDEGIVVNQKTENEGIKETVNETKNINEVIITTEEPQSDVPLVPTDTGQTAGSKLPPFIVYDQTRISNVAPALANLLAARTMANMSKKSQEGGKDKEVDAAVKQIVVPQSHSHIIKPQQDNKQKEEVNNMGVSGDTEQKSAVHSISGYKFETMDGKLIDVRSKRHPKANVVVEAVNTVSSGYTGLQSQQNSPRITPAPRSPDSGISELTADSKTTDDKSTTDQVPAMVKSEYGIDEGVQTRGSKRKLAERSGDGHNEKPDPNKRLRSALLEDSAVTLLSLLKKGPNYNPACPPKSGTVPPPSDTSRNVPSPSLEDSNSTGETEKPKSGISTSLLAVIEQLRERSKSDQDEEKTVLPSLPFVPKKASKRRSRRSSREDNESAAGIENVEQFDVDGQIKFRCKLCHYTNESTVLLKQHMRLHKPKQQFECSLCDLIAESSEALQDHMIQHCKVRTYQCKLCNQAFNYKSQLRAHMRMHNDQDILLCDFCDFETRSASALKAHTKSHLTKPPYKCDVCKEEFITSFNLRIHKREGCYTTIDKLGHFKCDKCDFTSLGRREMKNHQRAHLMKGVGHEHKVTYCDLTGLTLDQIQQHITDSQGELKTLKCDLCGFVAVSIRSLKSHMKRHVNDQRFVAQPLEQYKCNLCGYVCHHLPSLKSHMWRHAADQHYSYEFTNDVINAAIDFDSRIDAADTTKDHVANFKKLIFDKMKAKGLESTRNTQEESAAVCCWVTFRCCQCGFETINKAELNMHMTAHSDVIKWTLDVSEEERRQEDEIPMVVQEQVVPFMESNKAVPQIMNA